MFRYSSVWGRTVGQGTFHHDATQAQVLQYVFLPSFYHYISWYPHEYACVQISSKCWVSYRIAYYTLIKKEKLFTSSCWVDPPCRSFISAPLWSLSSLVRPCEGVKGQAGFYFIFLKALKDAQHVYTLSTNNKGKGCVTKGHQHGGDGARRTAGGEWKCVQVSLLYVCARTWLIVSWIPLTGIGPIRAPWSYWTQPIQYIFQLITAQVRLVMQSSALGPLVFYVGVSFNLFFFLHRQH